MGYDIRITRGPEFKRWLVGELPPVIALDELYRIAEKYPDLQIARDASPDEYVDIEITWNTDNPQRPLYIGEYFLFENMYCSEDHSDISRKLDWTTRAELEKMIFIAELLGAVVAGDEDEVFLPNGNVYSVVYNGPDDTTKEPEYEFSGRWEERFDKDGYQPSHYG